METTSRNQRFVIWLFTSLILGALPWFINFLIYFIADGITYYTIFRINDLMFFVIIISATTMVDILIIRDYKTDTSRILFTIILLVQVLIAALFLGISSLNIAKPPASGLFNPIQHRLITTCLILCSFSFITTLSIQIHICFFTKHKQ